MFWLNTLHFALLNFKNHGLIDYVYRSLVELYILRMHISSSDWAAFIIVFNFDYLNFIDRRYWTTFIKFWFNCNCHCLIVLFYHDYLNSINLRMSKLQKLIIFFLTCISCSCCTVIIKFWYNRIYHVLMFWMNIRVL